MAESGEVFVLSVDMSSPPLAAVSWNASVVETFTMYRLYRADNELMNDAVEILRQPDRNINSYGDEPGYGTWYYRVTVTYSDFDPCLSNVDSDDMPEFFELDLVVDDEVNALMDWEASGRPDFLSYEIWRSDNSRFGTPVLLTTITDIDEVEYTDEDPGLGTWYYKLVVNYDGDDPVESAVVSVEITYAVELSDEISGSRVTFSWAALEDAYYYVFRSKTAGVDANSTLLATILDWTENTFTDAPGVGTWYYNVYISPDGGGGPLPPGGG